MNIIKFVSKYYIVYIASILAFCLSSYFTGIRLSDIAIGIVFDVLFTTIVIVLLDHEDNNLRPI